MLASCRREISARRQGTNEQKGRNEFAQTFLVVVQSPEPVHPRARARNDAALRPMPRRIIASASDFGPMVDSNLSANFRSAETAKLSTKRVSAPDPEHPFQTRFQESRPTLIEGP